MTSVADNESRPESRLHQALARHNEYKINSLQCQDRFIAKSMLNFPPRRVNDSHTSDLAERCEGDAAGLQQLIQHGRKCERLLVPDLATEWFRKQKVFLDKVTSTELLVAASVEPNPQMARNRPNDVRSGKSCTCLFQADGQPRSGDCLAARRTEPLLPRLRKKYDLRQAQQRRLDPAHYRRISPEFYGLLKTYEEGMKQRYPLYGISKRYSLERRDKTEPEQSLGEQLEKSAVRKENTKEELKPQPETLEPCTKITCPALKPKPTPTPAVVIYTCHLEPEKLENSHTMVACCNHPRTSSGDATASPTPKKHKGILGGFAGLCKRCIRPGRHLLYNFNHSYRQYLKDQAERKGQTGEMKSKRRVRYEALPLFHTQPARCTWGLKENTPSNSTLKAESSKTEMQNGTPKSSNTLVNMSGNENTLQEVQKCNCQENALGGNYGVNFCPEVVPETYGPNNLQENYHDQNTSPENYRSNTLQQNYREDTLPKPYRKQTSQKTYGEDASQKKYRPNIPPKSKKAEKTPRKKYPQSGLQKNYRQNTLREKSRPSASAEDLKGNYRRNTSQENYGPNTLQENYPTNNSPQNYRQNCSPEESQQNYRQDYTQEASRNNHCQHTSPENYCPANFQENYRQNYSQEVAGDNYGQEAIRHDYSQNTSTGNYCPCNFPENYRPDYSQEVTGHNYRQEAIRHDYSQNNTTENYHQNYSTEESNQSYRQEASRNNCCQNSSPENYHQNYSTEESNQSYRQEASRNNCCQNSAPENYYPANFQENYRQHYSQEHNYCQKITSPENYRQNYSPEESKQSYRQEASSNNYCQNSSPENYCQNYSHEEYIRPAYSQEQTHTESYVSPQCPCTEYYNGNPEMLESLPCSTFDKCTQSPEHDTTTIAHKTKSINSLNKGYCNPKKFPCPRSCFLASDYLQLMRQVAKKRAITKRPKNKSSSPTRPEPKPSPIPAVKKKPVILRKKKQVKCRNKATETVNPTKALPSCVCTSTSTSDLTPSNHFSNQESLVPSFKTEKSLTWSTFTEKDSRSGYTTTPHSSWSTSKHYSSYTDCSLPYTSVTEDERKSSIHSQKQRSLCSLQQEARYENPSTKNDSPSYLDSDFGSVISKIREAPKLGYGLSAVPKVNETSEDTLQAPDEWCHCVTYIRKPQLKSSMKNSSWNENRLTQRKTSGCDKTLNLRLKPSVRLSEPSSQRLLKQQRKGLSWQDLEQERVRRRSVSQVTQVTQFSNSGSSEESLNFSSNSSAYTGISSSNSLSLFALPTTSSTSYQRGNLRRPLRAPRVEHQRKRLPPVRHQPQPVSVISDLEFNTHSCASSESTTRQVGGSHPKPTTPPPSPLALFLNKMPTNSKSTNLANFLSSNSVRRHPTYNALLEQQLLDKYMPYSLYKTRRH